MTVHIKTNQKRGGGNCLKPSLERSVPENELGLERGNEIRHHRRYTYSNQQGGKRARTGENRALKIMN